MNRRNFIKSSVLAATLTQVPEAFALSAKAAASALGTRASPWLNPEVAQAIETVASLGLYGFETFGDVLTSWESKGGLGAALEKNKPFRSSPATAL